MEEISAREQADRLVAAALASANSRARQAHVVAATAVALAVAALVVAVSARREPAPPLPDRHAGHLQRLILDPTGKEVYMAWLFQSAESAVFPKPDVEHLDFAVGFSRQGDPCRIVETVNVPGGPVFRVIAKGKSVVELNERERFAAFNRFEDAAPAFRDSVQARVRNAPIVDVEGWTRFAAEGD